MSTHTLHHSPGHHSPGHTGRGRILRRTGLMLVALPLAIGSLVTGCSNSTAHPAATELSTAPSITMDLSDMGSATSTTSTTAPTATTVAPPTTHGKVHAPAPSTTAAPTPTLAEPPVSVPTPVVTLSPILVGVLFFPTVNTVTATTHFTCLEAALAGFATQVSWTTSNASSVTVLVNGGVFATGQPAVSNIFVPLSCGTSTTVVISARWADGSAGGSKSVLLKVDPI